MSGRRTRKSINQINVVPYIDVMLVLLVIFMVTAPFIQPGQVELPSIGKSSAPPAAPLEVMVKADGSLLLRDRQTPGNAEPLSQEGLLQAIRARSEVHKDQPVVISADRQVRYERVMQVMDALQKAGVPRVGLLVRPASP